MNRIQKILPQIWSSPHCWSSGAKQKY